MALKRLLSGLGASLVMAGMLTACGRDAGTSSSPEVARLVHQLRVVQVPYPPKGYLSRALPGDRYSSEAARRVGAQLEPVGIDAAGNVLLEAPSGCCGFIIRYDPGTHRYLPGVVYAPESGPVSPSPDGSEWIPGAHSGSQWVERSVFSDKLRGGRESATCCTGQSSGVSFDRRGGAWIAGWNTGGAPFVCCGSTQASAPGLPKDDPPGWPALYHWSPSSPGFHPVRVPVPGPLRGVSVSKLGIVWAMDPYRRCTPSHGRTNCSGPRIVRYSPTSGRFKSYAIPPRALPTPCCRRTAFDGLDVETPMAMATDGEVWILANVPSLEYEGGRHVRLIGFKDGRFTSWRITLGLFGSSRPTVDRKGNVWLCDSNGQPVVVNSHSGQRTRLPLHGGAIFQDPVQDKVSYVVGPKPAPWVCGGP